MSKGIKVTVDDKKSELTIVMPLIAVPKPSKSGKSLTIASTFGNYTSEATYSGHPVVVGINAYIRNSG